MASRRSRGLTVAELLVVAAVIGILAAMLVPVFATSRDEARTTTCMSNQQQIVNAIRMYMSDHDDTLPPREHREEVLLYFDTAPGGATYIPVDETGHCRYAAWANPYLRWPVILESYLASRDVWRCPSARLEHGATLIVPGPDWLQYLQWMEGMWGRASANPLIGPCYWAWPTGWGGAVTDSILQGTLASPWWYYGSVSEDVFQQSIAAHWHPDLHLSEVADPARFVTTSDAGVTTNHLGLGATAYPELCALECGNQVCGWVDWDYCTWAVDCGLYNQAPNSGSFLRNVSFRLPYARHRARFAPGVPGPLRHGVIVGFLDGHLEWVPSETLIGRSASGDLLGVEHWGPVSDCGFADTNPGVPTLY
jgi:type II secretory pathway pseudopilin PulG